MMTGFSDLPGNQDMLGMDIKCQGIADFISTCETPMTVAIKGDWGTGKTTVMNLILKKLDPNGDSQNVIWFNAWQFSVFDDQSSLIFDLLSMLVDKLTALTQERINEGGKVEAPVRLQQDDIETDIPREGSPKNAKRVGGAIAKAGLAVGTAFLKQKIEVLFDAVEQLTGMAGLEPAAAAASPMPVSRTHHVDEKCRMVQRLIDELLKGDDKKRIYIFVDDLDRLAPEFAVEFMEGLKILMDYKKCVFILAVDQEVVERGLQKKYGADFDREKARKFFDKIIQVPFSLPVYSYDLRKYLSTLLSGVGAQELDGYLHLLEGFDVRNPRTIKRCLFLLQLFDCIDRAGQTGNVATHSDEKLRRFALLLLQIEATDTYTEVLATITRNHISGKEYDYARIGKDIQEQFDSSESSREFPYVAELFFKSYEDTAGITAFVSAMLQTSEIVGETKDWSADIPMLQATRRLVDFLDGALPEEMTDCEEWSGLVSELKKDNKELLEPGFEIPQDTISLSKDGVRLTITKKRSGYPNLNIYGIPDTNALSGIRDKFFQGKKDKYEYNKYMYFLGDEDSRLTVASIRFVSKSTLTRLLENCGLLEVRG